jgi:hypothetical protein
LKQTHKHSTFGTSILTNSFPDFKCHNLISPYPHVAKISDVD